MSRQTKYPPIFSICLAIARHSDASILVSKLDLVPPSAGAHQEFPHSLYVDVLEMPIEATLDKRPTEKEILSTCAGKLASLAANPKYIPKRESISYLGLYQSPNWGVCIHYLKYYVLAVVDDDDLKTLEGYEWSKPSAMLEDYNNFKFRLSPPTRGLLRSLMADLPAKAHIPMNDGGSHSSRFWRALARDIETEEWGAHTHLEYAPNIECIPILSNTLFPFHATNLVTIFDGSSDLMIVDPGSNDHGKAHLEAVLSRIQPTTLHVFLTHHHHDHIQSLDVVERLFPSAFLVGHPYTLDKVSSSLTKRPMCSADSDETYMVGSTTIQVLSLPGHTRGHLALWEAASKTLVSGDHTVGFGSSVLDPDGGGNMASYLSSTERLLKFDIQVILPCHGMPTLSKPNKLLQTYIDHRMEREKAIAGVWKSGVHSIDDLIRAVYTDIPEKMHPAAKRNVILHLEKLEDEKAIQLTTEVAALVHAHRQSAL